MNSGDRISSEETNASISSGPKDSLESSLASQLAIAMVEAWRRGECLSADDMLREHPEVAETPEGAVRLIYEEICLRQARGEEEAAADCIRRYPRWQSGIEAVMACHRLVESSLGGPDFPRVGEQLGECCIVGELGRGAHGRVYLADQPFLASRLVVLKVIPYSSREHLKLARLQHTHIVPLYSVQDFPERGLRSLCMPYLGGTTLDKIQSALQAIPIDERTGGQLLAALDRQDTHRPAMFPQEGPVRRLIERSGYVEGICWIGVHLADAIGHAHEQGLLHLDIKPSNVLLTSDGRPMLLDFHLARRPIPASGESPDWIGGTPQYMSPEQHSAWRAAKEGRPTPSAVDGRSDVYSLGVLLRECLSEPLSKEQRSGSEEHRRLHRSVTPGLQDILSRCLSPSAEDRYSTASELGDDLRRQLSGLPLKGVRNRSLVERYRKWKRHRPQAAMVAGLTGVVAVLAALFGWLAWSEWQERETDANVALARARSRNQSQQFADAERSAARALERFGSLPFAGDVVASLRKEQQTARQGRAIADLHVLTEKIRYLQGDEHPSREWLERLAAKCGEIWGKRAAILDSEIVSTGGELGRQARTDLLDLAILWTNLRQEVAEMGGEALSNASAAQTLREATALLGESPILKEELQRYEPASAELWREASQPRSAWEWYALGRRRMQEEEYAKAREMFTKAVEISPSEFWPWFYLGTCNFRLERYEESREAFQVATALRPGSAECHYNKALAEMAMKDGVRARADLDLSLAINPSFAPAELNRGVLNLLEGKLPEAEADLKGALSHGADTAIVHYNLALVCRARDDRAGAITNLEIALANKRDFPKAEELRSRLVTELGR